MEQTYLKTEAGRDLAYDFTPGAGPTVVFCGGLNSDKEGTKAIALEDWARARGQAFLRFDYSGHGKSSGQFTDGCIGDWAADARAMVDAVTDGPLVLVGSSMGGWVSLLLARALPDRMAGLVTIAGAPDFTERMWQRLSQDDRATVERDGFLLVPSDYGEPYTYTRRLFEDGRKNQVIHSPLGISCPVRILHGAADDVVETQVALDLFEHIEGPDIRLELVKGADHRFSDETCIARIINAVEEAVDAASA